MRVEDALTDLKSIFYHKHGLYIDDLFAFNMAFEAIKSRYKRNQRTKNVIMFVQDVVYGFLLTMMFQRPFPSRIRIVSIVDKS